MELVGVGYRAAVNGSQLTMQLGYSHDVVYKIPSDVSIKCEKPTMIAITGASKQKVGQVAAVLRSYRLPEPYKGKGIIRENEFVVRKEGKKK
jgi:large subunit ribosomal protein L6